MNTNIDWTPVDGRSFGQGPDGTKWQISGIRDSGGTKTIRVDLYTWSDRDSGWKLVVALPPNEHAHRGVFFHAERVALALSSGKSQGVT